MSGPETRGRGPETRARLNGTALVILKWMAGIMAAVIGSLLVIILMGTAHAVSSNGNRLTRVEAKNEARDEKLDRIERQVDKIADHLMPVGTPRRRR